MDKSKIAVDVFNKLAKEYAAKFMDVSLYHATFDVFCKAIAIPNANVLELACGPGNITHYLLSKRPDLKITGTDLAPNMLEIAKQHNPTATFQILDARNIKSLKQTYDAIMCGFCLPYLSKEEALQLISDASDVLGKNGVIYISTMEDDYSKSGLRKGSTGDEIFMHFHEADYLTQALEAKNFKVIELKRIISTMTDGSEVCDLVIIATK